MTQPRPIRTRRLDGTPLPEWLDGHHHHDAGQLVVHTPDGHAQPRPGWTLVGWTDGTVTVASPTTVERVYGPDGIAAQLTHAEAAIARARAMHQPTEGLGFDSDEDDTPGSYGYIAQVCGACGKPDEYGVRWPCATTRALNDPKDTP